MEKEKSLLLDLKNQNDGETFDFEIPEQLGKKNVAYSSILLDLQTCKEALVQLKNRNNDIVMISLFTTVIILYGKCFTDSSSSKSTKIESTIFENEDKFQNLHLELMNLRHNFIAHRGFSEHEFGKAYFQINPKKMIWGIKVGIRKRHNFESNKILEYEYLIDFLLVKIEEKYNKVGQKIVKYMFENMFNDGKEQKLKMIKNDNIDYKKLIDNISKNK